MGLTNAKPFFQRIGPLGVHQTNILKRVLGDSKIKIFQDEKGAAERTEIQTDKGIVTVYKDYELATKFARYKKVEVQSYDGEPLGSLDIITEPQTMLHPSCRFLYGTSQIGKGTGEIAMVIAAKLLGEEGIDPRYVVGSTVDQEVIETIRKMLDRKTF